MKLNLDLCRQILLDIENSPTGCAQNPITIPEHTHEEIAYHRSGKGDSQTVTFIITACVGGFKNASVQDSSTRFSTEQTCLL